MKLHSTLVAIVAIALSSCTAILTETTGDQGIRENPAERTTGAMIEDEVIETKIAVNMRSQEPAFKQSNFSVVSHNGVVLLIGQVESDSSEGAGDRIASRPARKSNVSTMSWKWQGKLVFYPGAMTRGLPPRSERSLSPKAMCLPAESK